jgi:hypothetical protein
MNGIKETDLVTDCSRHLEERSNQSKLNDCISNKSEISQLTNEVYEVCRPKLT